MKVLLALCLVLLLASQAAAQSLRATVPFSRAPTILTMTASKVPEGSIVVFYIDDEWQDIRYPSEGYVVLVHLPDPGVYRVHAIVYSPQSPGARWRGVTIKDQDVVIIAGGRR
jgi:hypothetical protein